MLKVQRRSKKALFDYRTPAGPANPMGELKVQIQIQFQFQPQFSIQIHFWIENRLGCFRLAGITTTTTTRYQCYETFFPNSSYYQVFSPSIIYVVKT
jgi:hypothetical protein